MVRVLPHACVRARRTTGALATLCLVFSGLLAGAPAAVARDGEGLDDQGQRVQKRIKLAKLNLDEVSHQLVDATASLQRAEARLAEAQVRLAEVRGELAAAQALDEQLQTQLAEAEDRLVEAQAALSSGQRKVTRQRDTLAALVVEQFQGENPQLLELSALLSAGSPLALSNQMAAVDGLLEQGNASLGRLRATRVLLLVQEGRVDEARREVAQSRVAAAANLESSQQAEAVAIEAEQAVAAMVTARAEAEASARRAVRKEEQRLAALRAERLRIRDMLLDRAERQAARHVGRSFAGPSAGFAGPSAGYLRFPVRGPVTSPFGMRLHPILRVVRLHDGTDFGAPCGTPIRAAADGAVIASYRSSSYGRRLILANGFVRGVSLSTSYNHLSRTAVSVGDRVSRGQVVGYVGSTGYSTGCHLHFMVYEDGQAVEPISWL